MTSPLYPKITNTKEHKHNTAWPWRSVHLPYNRPLAAHGRQYIMPFLASIRVQIMPLTPLN